MPLICPTSHKYRQRPARIGARHRRVRRVRQRVLACAQSRPVPRLDDALAGSLDPMWAARAQGRFIGGALRSPSRHPLVTVARVLMLAALASSALSPLFRAAREAGVSPLGGSSIAGLVVLALAAVALLLTRR